MIAGHARTLGVLFEEARRQHGLRQIEPWNGSTGGLPRSTGATDDLDRGALPRRMRSGGARCGAAAAFDFVTLDELDRGIARLAGATDGAAAGAEHARLDLGARTRGRGQVVLLGRRHRLADLGDLGDPRGAGFLGREQSGLGHGMGPLGFVVRWWWTGDRQIVGVGMV